MSKAYTESLSSRLLSHTKLATKYALELSARVDELEAYLVKIDCEANSWRGKYIGTTTDKDECADKVSAILRDLL